MVHNDGWQWFMIMVDNERCHSRLITTADSKGQQWLIIQVNDDPQCCSLLAESWCGSAADDVWLKSPRITSNQRLPWSMINHDRQWVLTITTVSTTTIKCFNCLGNMVHSNIYHYQSTFVITLSGQTLISMVNDVAIGSKVWPTIIDAQLVKHLGNHRGVTLVDHC